MPLNRVSTRMAFYIKKDESLSDAFLRIGMEEIDTGIQWIEKKKTSAAVHKVRTRCKRIRGLARLYRDALGKKQYKKVNRHFRDLAKSLGDLRDAKTMIDTYEKVVEEWNGKGWKFASGELEDSLKKNRKAERKKEISDKEVLKEARMSLKEGRKILAKAAKKIEEEPSLLIKGLERVFRRGHSALERVNGDGSVREYHELRKRVKYLRYLLKLLRKSWAPMINPLVDELGRAGGHLGDDHDLAVLLRFAEERLGRCNKKRMEILQAVIPLSIRHRSRATCSLEFIYLESPEAFSERVISYFRRSRAS